MAGKDGPYPVTSYFGDSFCLFCLPCLSRQLCCWRTDSSYVNTSPSLPLSTADIANQSWHSFSSILLGSTCLYYLPEFQYHSKEVYFPPFSVAALDGAEFADHLFGKHVVFSLPTPLPTENTSHYKSLGVDCIIKPFNPVIINYIGTEFSPYDFMTDHST